MVFAAGNQPISKYCWIAFQELSTVFSSGNPARVQVDMLDSNQATFSDAHLAERNVCSRARVEGRKAVGSSCSQPDQRQGGLEHSHRGAGGNRLADSDPAGGLIRRAQGEREGKEGIRVSYWEQVDGGSFSLKNHSMKKDL